MLVFSRVPYQKDTSGFSASAAGASEEKLSDFGDIFLDAVVNEVLVYEICMFGQRIDLRVLGIAKKTYMLNGPSFHKIAPNACFSARPIPKRVHRPFARAP